MIKPKKSLLLVGESSKIAQEFLDTFGNLYELHATHNLKRNTNIPENNTYKLDLESSNSLKQFSSKVKNIEFDSVIVFASTYFKDSQSTNPEKHIDATAKNIAVNAGNIVALLNSVKLKPKSTVILFGDSGLGQPNKDFSSYSISKSLLSSLTKILAVELSPKTKVITFNLGPVLAGILDKNDKKYYDHGLIKVDKPVDGLIKFINFVINEDDLYVTGSEFNYDGGAYLKRH